jgi:hypothetical protein
MWLLELILLSMVIGIPLGLGIRSFDNWWENAKAEAVKAAEEATASKK